MTQKTQATPQVQAIPIPAFVKNPANLKKFTRHDVAKHRSEGDLWIIVDSLVWLPLTFLGGSRSSLSKFVDMHPGGAHVLLANDVAGKDATDAFFGLHRSDVLAKYSRYIVGQIEGESSTIIYPSTGALSPVPYAEPGWLTTSYHSPYFNDGHRALALAMRKFVDTEIIPEARVHELTDKRPSQELIKKMSEAKILHMRLGPGSHLHGLTLPGGMRGEDFDYLAELVVTQEIARLGARGYQDGLSAGMWIGLTPILNFGTDQQKKDLIPPVLAGEKHICLAISEAFAGSDVAGIRTTATLTPDKKFFIVNGTKCDYFSTAVKTSSTGMTMLLIPRCEGVETKLISTSYSKAAGTSFVTFDNVKVPVENVIGKVDQGFKIVLSNFNHERLVMNHFTCRQIRLITEECFKWAHQRKVFGKPLIEQPVIRQKFGAMFARCEAGQNWLENVTYQMSLMSYAQQAEHLAGPIGLLKAYLTRCAHDVADDAVQIFGGRGITKGGMGQFVELFQRSYKFDAVLGGSEEILMDLGVKQASKKMPKAVL
ncbi:acyl-CoA dehydrogenase NM domain-like protein [Meredithblackwellia eburnea MCA 4105]